MNIPFFLDGLWAKEINEYFVESLTGSIAFRAGDFGCDSTYIFTAKYYPDGVGDNYKTKALSSMVDIESWKVIGADNISTAFEDIHYKYILYKTSESIFYIRHRMAYI